MFCSQLTAELQCRSGDDSPNSFQLWLLYVFKYPVIRCQSALRGISRTLDQHLRGRVRLSLCMRGTVNPSVGAVASSLPVIWPFSILHHIHLSTVAALAPPGVPCATAWRAAAWQHAAVYKAAPPVAVVCARNQIERSIGRHIKSPARRLPRRIRSAGLPPSPLSTRMMAHVVRLRAYRSKMTLMRS